MDTIEYFPMAESLDSLKLPFSEAVRVGTMLYLSGAMGIDATGALVPGGIEAETRQALANSGRCSSATVRRWIGWSSAP